MGLPLILSNGAVLLAGGLPVSVDTSAFIPTTLQSAVTSPDGVTWTFNKFMPVGYFVTGEPFVVSSEAFQLTATSPASRDIASNGSIGDGVMQDPYITTAQGWDQYLASTAGDATESVSYDGALNVDPSKPGGSAVSISLGQETSFVKAIRRSGVTAGDWQTFDRYSTLTVLSAAPAVGAYMPSPSELTTKTIFKRSDINTACLRSLTFPGSWLSHATIKASIASDIGLYGDGANTSESRRRFRLDKVLGGSSNYAGNIVEEYARYMLDLHNSAVSAGDRQDIIDFIMKGAIQQRGLASRGWRQLGAETQKAGGAGQFANVVPYCFIAGYLTNSTEFLNIAKLHADDTLLNSLWVDASFVPLPTPGAGGTGAGSKSGQPFFEELIGQPVLIPDELTSAYGRYTPIAEESVGWEVLAMGAMQAGPNSRDGLTEILNGNALSTSTPRAAVIANLDRLRTERPAQDGAYFLEADWLDAYDLIRPLSALSLWTGKPSQIPANQITLSTPSDGAIRATLATGLDYATETVTGTDFRYSLDGRQWVVDSDITLSSNAYTKSGLLRGAPHWIGMRQKSASGNGLWSPNFPVELPVTSGTDRLKATTTGTATATAPSWAGGVAPAILSRLAPQWDYEVWEPPGSSLNVRQYAAGVGYPSAGYPAPTTYGYAWELDAVSTGDTTYKIDIEPVEARGQTLSCDVTATNASGSATSSPSITVPSYFGMKVPQTSTWGSTTDASSDSRTVDIGPARTDRWLVVILTGHASTTTLGANVPNTLTIGGVSFTRVVYQHALRNPDGAWAQVWVSDSKIPSGTTATAAWSTTGGNVTLWYGAIFQIIKSTAPTLEGSDGWTGILASGGANQALTANSASGGFAVIGAQINSGTANADVDLYPRPYFSFETVNPTARSDFYTHAAEHTTGSTYEIEAQRGQSGTFAYALATFS